MSNVATHPAYQAMQQGMLQRRLVARLADAIITKLQIPPHDTQLIWCIGSGLEDNNLGAVRYWIERELSSGNYALDSTLINELSDKLRSMLSDLIEQWI